MTSTWKYDPWGQCMISILYQMILFIVKIIMLNWRVASLENDCEQLEFMLQFGISQLKERTHYELIQSYLHHFLQVIALFSVKLFIYFSRFTVTSSVKHPACQLRLLIFLQRRWVLLIVCINSIFAKIITETGMGPTGRPVPALAVHGVIP